MNVIQVVDAGHYEKTEGKGKDARQVCRECGEEFPCTMILAARKQAKANRGTTENTTGSKKA